jgi:hypothetical protein
MCQSDAFANERSTEQYDAIANDLILRKAFVDKLIFGQYGDNRNHD